MNNKLENIGINASGHQGTHRKVPKASSQIGELVCRLGNGLFENIWELLYKLQGGDKDAD